MAIKRKKEVEEEIVNSDDNVSDFEESEEEDDDDSVTQSEIENSENEGDDDDENEYESEDESVDEIEGGNSDLDAEEEEEIEETRSKKKTVCYMKDLDGSEDKFDYASLEYTRIPDSERTCEPVMSYYEMVGIIGTRAQQFNLGAPPLISGVDKLHPAQKAYLELIAGMTPFIIRRHLPLKKYEDWKVNELRIIYNITDEFYRPKNFDWEKLMKYSYQNNFRIIPKSSKKNK